MFTGFIFYNQQLKDKRTILQSIRTQLRKTALEQAGIPINAESALNLSNIHMWMSDDFAYRMLADIGGSPPYWRTVFNDLLGMYRVRYTQSVSNIKSKERV